MHAVRDLVVAEAGVGVGAGPSANLHPLVRAVADGGPLVTRLAPANRLLAAAIGTVCLVRAELPRVAIEVIALVGAELDAVVPGRAGPGASVVLAAGAVVPRRVEGVSAAAERDTPALAGPQMQTQDRYRIHSHQRIQSRYPASATHCPFVPQPGRPCAPLLIEWCVMQRLPGSELTQVPV